MYMGETMIRWSKLFVACLALALVQPASAIAASSPAMVSLEQQMQALASSKSADVGIAAIDLATGESVTVKGNTPFPMASTVKIAVAASYLSQVDAGRRGMRDTIGKSNARALMERMLIHSDNHATDMLIHDLGGPRAIQKWLDHYQVGGMRVDRNIAQLLRDPRDLWDRRDSATPMAMAQFLRRLDREPILSASSKAILFDMMRRCATGKNRMKSLLPIGANVAHKTGTLNGYASDVGYMSLPDGRRVALAIFTRGGNNRPRTIAEAARTLYDGFRTVLTWNFQPPLAPSQ